MPKNFTFWRNVALIAGLHVVAIVTFARWSHESRNAVSQTVVWMNGSAGGGDPGRPQTPPKPMALSTPAAEPTVVPRKEDEEEQSEQDHPILAAATSEIRLPSVTPAPSSTPKATATPKPAPTAPARTPAPKPKTSPTPRPKAKPSPKPSPKKLVLAKASPRPKPTPEKPEEVKAKKEPPNEEMTPEPVATPLEQTKPVTAQSPPATGKEATGGNGGHAGGGGGQSRFGWYGSMLHDRFYSEWVQPTNAGSSGGSTSVLVRLRIEKDGHVSSFDVVRPSGNAEIDDSVRAAAKRVTQVDPLPPGLGNGDHYDVKIKFELSSD